MRNTLSDRRIPSEIEDRHEPKVARMQPNGDRIREALLFLIGEADKRKIDITQYTILKACFLADRSHLNRFGRPITFDNYSAMKDGPVASRLYGVLKHETTSLSAIGLRRPAWQRQAAPQISERAFVFSRPSRKYDADILSESDIEALSEALTVVASLSFSQIRKLTHGDPAYIAAWRDDGNKKAYDMNLGLFFDIPNFEKAEELAFISKHV